VRIDELKILRGLSSVLGASLLLLVCLVGSLMAQEITGSISGLVSDPSGSAIPNARVSVTAPSLPRGIDVTSDSSGIFTVPQLPAGQYSVAVQATGFTTAKKNEVPVVLGRVTRLDFRMEVGQVTESVVISADAVMVDATSSASAVTVDRTFFDILPKGRSFYDLAAIAPGARPETKSGGVQVDGASGSENTYYIDGMEVTNIQTGVLSDKNRIPVEMVQQMQIKNGVMEAQYGGAMGGVLSAVVRSGTNDFHGQGGMYFYNDSMWARPRPSLRLDPKDEDLMTSEYFQNAQDSFTNFNPVVNIGGPIVKNRLFFFAGYMPRFVNTDRNVNFVDGSKGAFNQKYTQQYTVGKLDYSPASRLRLNGSWIWNPTKSMGVLPSRQGTDDPHSNYGEQGSYSAGQIVAGSVDYLPTNRLVLSFRGGYNRTNNNTNYGIGTATSIYYSNNNAAIPGIPPDLVGAAGWQTFAPGATLYDIYTRKNYNADATYVFSAAGQHSIKGGWQMNELGNNVNTTTYANGYYRYYWNLSYRCITSQCTGQQRGAYGYYRYRFFGTTGNVSSNNQSLFLQDTWRVSKNLTLNLGIRTEREYLPSFASGTSIPSRAIEFSWAQKLSPRIGFAWDPNGDGTQRIYASWGYFYDIMKYELPRGSFGGDQWYDTFFSLDDPNWVKLNQGIPTDPTKIRGRFFEYVNWRIPSNDPNNYTIDPNLKPMKQRMFDIGYERSITSTLVASARYTNRRLIRTIEDVGTLGPAGEVYYIGNPGFGITADPKTWDAGFPVTPKARREYDALELRADKRFSRSYQFAISYTWARQDGNYSGLASSDENGRTSPNVNRYFDLPWVYYTERGNFASGPLATDRRHTLKFFGGYTLNSRVGATTFSPNVFLYSGVPITTEVTAISSVPTAPYGRGDLGRTPVYFNTDFNVMHDFKPVKSNEALRFRIEATIFNLFNNSAVTNYYTTMNHTDYGQLQFAHEADIFKGFNTKQMMAAQELPVDSRYRQATEWQNPRNIRLQFTFFF